MSSSKDPGIEFAEASHVGMRRANNQDSKAVMIATSEKRVASQGHLFLVADGMGAHAAGELASQIASERIALHYYQTNLGSPAESLAEAVRQANQAIFERGQSNPEFHNMGTTASSMVIVGGSAHIAHVGDSRIYRLRRGVFEQLTFDHSLVWEMPASSGRMPKNVITRSLGPAAEVLVDVEGPFELQIGDRFLLCSDGLTGEIEDDMIGTLLDCLDVQTAVKVLIELANLQGGNDNITVVALEVANDSATQSSTATSRRPKPKRDGHGPSRVLLVTTLACWLVAIAFALASAVLTNSLIGPAVVAFVLGAISVGVWASGLFGKPSVAAAFPTMRDTEDSLYRGGDAPYRRYPVVEPKKMIARLRETIDVLRNTADEKHWSMDWKKIDGLCAKAEQAMKSSQGKEAIAMQCHAIVETMSQFRIQIDQAANDTVIDL
ncbi:MAG: protein phosphatase 2C domain-containing protein [Planctomycetota bacterium]